MKERVALEFKPRHIFDKAPASTPQSSVLTHRRFRPPRPTDPSIPTCIPAQTPSIRVIREKSRRTVIRQRDGVTVCHQGPGALENMREVRRGRPMSNGNTRQTQHRREAMVLTLPSSRATRTQAHVADHVRR
jgi:hypothetical protein